MLPIRVCASAKRSTGVLAQLVERLNGIEEVRGSNPLGSTARGRIECLAYYEDHRVEIDALVVEQMTEPAP